MLIGFNSFYEPVIGYVDEDGYYDIPLSTLQSHATDVDNPVSELKFGIQSDGAIIGEYNPNMQVLHITTIPNWFGVQVVKIIATDPANDTGHQNATVTVNPQPDPALPFDLIYPIDANLFTWIPNLTFSWHHSVDPDPGDNVTYRWLLSRDQTTSDILMQADVGSDSCYVPIPSVRMYKGQYYWKVIATSTDGSTVESAVTQFSLHSTAVDEHVSTELPTEFALLPNHPNPFNPETKISYHLPYDTAVKLEIYNSLGQLILILDSGQKRAGVHTVFWNANDVMSQRVSSGIYYCRLVAGREVKFIKMLLLQ